MINKVVNNISEKISINKVLVQKEHKMKLFYLIVVSKKKD